MRRLGNVNRIGPREGFFQSEFKRLVEPLPSPVLPIARGVVTCRRSVSVIHRSSPSHKQSSTGPTPITIRTGGCSFIFMLSTAGQERI